MSLQMFSRLIQTAAHCLFPKPYHNSLMDTTNVQVTVGVGGKHIDLMDVKIHPEWKFNTKKYDADVAVVTLFNPVDVMPICLPPAGTNDIIVPNGIFVSSKTIDLKMFVKKSKSSSENFNCLRFWFHRDIIYKHAESLRNITNMFTTYYPRLESITLINQTFVIVLLLRKIMCASRISQPA